MELYGHPANFTSSAAYLILDPKWRVFRYRGGWIALSVYRQGHTGIVAEDRINQANSGLRYYRGLK